MTMTRALHVHSGHDAPGHDGDDDAFPPELLPRRPRPARGCRRAAYRDRVVVHIQGGVHVQVHVEVNVNLTLADWYCG